MRVAPHRHRQAMTRGRCGRARTASCPRPRPAAGGNVIDSSVGRRRTRSCPGDATSPSPIALTYASFNVHSSKKRRARSAAGARSSQAGVLALGKKPLGDAVADVAVHRLHVDADIRSAGDGAGDETVRVGQVEREPRHPLVEDRATACRRAPRETATIGRDVGVSRQRRSQQRVRRRVVSLVAREPEARVAACALPATAASDGIEDVGVAERVGRAAPHVNVARRQGDRHVIILPHPTSAPRDNRRRLRSRRMPVSSNSPDLF